jgi:hypothetical protein
VARKYLVALVASLDEDIEVYEIEGQGGNVEGMLAGWVNDLIWQAAS